MIKHEYFSRKTITRLSSYLSYLRSFSISTLDFHSFSPWKKTISPFRSGKYQKLKLKYPAFFCLHLLFPFQVDVWAGFFFQQALILTSLFALFLLLSAMNAAVPLLRLIFFFIFWEIYYLFFFPALAPKRVSSFSFFRPAPLSAP